MLTVAPGAVLTGGPGGSAAIFDSPSNELDNSGTLQTFDGATGLTISSLSGDTTVSNGGLLLGSVGLAAGGNNVLHNLSGGTILAGPSLDLGGTGVLQNDGVLQIGSGAIGGTRINGSFIQSALGSLALRVDQATHAADAVSVSGAAQLGGVLGVTTLNPGRVTPGSFSLAAVVADGGLHLDGLTLSSARSAILNYALSTSGNTLNLTSTANFAPAGLSGYGQSVAAVFGHVQGEAMSQFSEAVTTILVRIPDLATLDGAYRTLGGSGISTVPKVTMDAGMTAIQTVTNRLDGWRIGDLTSQMGGQNAALTADSAEKPATAHIWIAPNASYNGGSGLSSHMFGSTFGVDAEAPAMPLPVGGAFTFSQAYFSLSEPAGERVRAAIWRQRLRGGTVRRCLCFGGCLWRDRESELRPHAERFGIAADQRGTIPDLDHGRTVGDGLYTADQRDGRARDTVLRGGADAGASGGGQRELWGAGRGLALSRDGCGGDADLVGCVTGWALDHAERVDPGAVQAAGLDA